MDHLLIIVLVGLATLVPTTVIVLASALLEPQRPAPLELHVEHEAHPEV